MKHYQYSFPNMVGLEFIPNWETFYFSNENEKQSETSVNFNWN